MINSVCGKAFWIVAPIIMLFFTVTSSSQGRDYPTSQLFDGALRGDYEQVAEALKNGAKAEVVKGHRPLELAAQGGFADICELLISAGADVDRVDYLGDTVLTMTPRSRSADKDAITRTCLALISKGADINHQNKRGQSALFLAVEYDNVPLFKALIQIGANPNLKDSSNRTVLHLCTWDEYYSLCELLISKGVDIDVQDNEKRTPLTIAAQGGQLDIVKLLVNNGANVNLKDTLNHKSAIEYASDYPDIANFLRNYKSGTPIKKAPKISTPIKVPSEDVQKSAQKMSFMNQYQQAEHYFSIGEYGEALRLFWLLIYPDKTLAEQMGKAETIRTNIGSSYYNWGVKELNRKNPTAAKKIFQDLAQFSPDDSKVKELLAFCNKYPYNSTDSKYWKYVEALWYRPLAGDLSGTN